MGPRDMSALFSAGSPVSWPMVYIQQVFLHEQRSEGVEPQLEVQKVMLPGGQRGSPSIGPGALEIWV